MARCLEECKFACFPILSEHNSFRINIDCKKPLRNIHAMIEYERLVGVGDAVSPLDGAAWTLRNVKYLLRG